MRMFAVPLLLAVLMLAPTLHAATPTSSVEAFNRALDSATRHMDNTAILALWAEDGVSLLPSTAPIVGKKAIGEFLTRVTGSLAGAKMETFEMQCHDLTVSGDLATEWCTAHQVVRFADKKQPPFDGWGKMLFVLHRAADGRWLVKTEMWNQALAPGK